MATARRWLGDAVWDWIFRLFAVSSLLLGTMAILNVRQHAECQATYNEINNRRSQIINEPNTRFDEALVAILLDPAAATPAEDRTQEERDRLRGLTLEWIKAAGDLRQARIDNPIPPPPSALCG